MTEVDELKACFEHAVTLFNARDVAAWATYNHDEVIFFSPRAPFAVEEKEALLRAMQALVSQSESISWRIINPQFRVVGNTGVTWGHYAFTIKPHDGPVRTEFARFCSPGSRVRGSGTSSPNTTLAFPQAPDQHCA